MSHESSAGGMSEQCGQNSGQNHAQHIEAAAEWMVRLTSGAASEQDRQAFARWQAADPAHARAWDALQSAVEAPFAALGPIGKSTPQASGNGRALRVALTRDTPPSPNRRRLLKGVAGIGAAAICGYGLRYPTGDLHTDLAQREHIVLADHSDLLLDARSAVDIRYTGEARRVELNRGQLIATVAPDPARPFVVSTRHGTVRALGTRFLVKLEGDRTLVAVLEHSVRLRTRDGMESTLHEGEVGVLAGGRILRLPDGAERYAAWQHGVIDVRNAPLGEVIEALRPYHRGWIRVSDAAADVRVFGVFPLDRSDDALRALCDTLPVRQRRFSPWLTLVDLAQDT